MPPKKKFSRQQIIDTAFDVAKQEGIDAVTIRKVADRMGSSIAPIYVNFNDIEELKQAVIHKTFAVSQEMLKEQYSPKPFRNIAIASLRFAREYSVLFRDLVMKNNRYMKEYEPYLVNVVEIMKEDSDLAGFSEEELMGILFKMRVFQLGLSVMYANGLLPDEFTEDRLIAVLDSTGNDIITAARIRKEKEGRQTEGAE